MNSPTGIHGVDDLAGVHLSVVSTSHPLLVSDVQTRSGLTDWSDRASVHRAVMRLFPDHLPGPKERRRSAGGILYRLERAPSGSRLLIQSLVPLEQSDESIRSTTLAGLANALTSGMPVRFRIDVNAVREKSRSTQRIPVPLEDIPAFLLDPSSADRPGLLSSALTALNVDSVSIEVSRAGKTPIRIAQIAGSALVADPSTLAAKMVTGVGRAKSYGCGLISVVPS